MMIWNKIFFIPYIFYNKYKKEDKMYEIIRC